MTTIFAKKALLHDGWADDIRLTVSNGSIEHLESGVQPDDPDIVAGIVIPGMANAHSHAFQRALAGHTEHRGLNGHDSFWTWRSRMYRLAGLMDAEKLLAIARQAYNEMLIGGYTSVAEFHYLHSEPESIRNSNGMLHAIAQAAQESGIRLTYVPVLYERAGFDEPQPSSVQRRFAMTLERFVDHYAQARDFANSNFKVAIGAHSLRAVQKSSISVLAELAQRDACPMHIHIAEQAREVEQCSARHGARPVEWLLREFSPNENWCLVHATHIDEQEITALQASAAVVCLCPSTEANLGDGLFPLQMWLQEGGKIAIGSDSHVTINPFEELRWLEYGQRLKMQSRNIAAISRPNTGRSLYDQALLGGAVACGNQSPVIKVGACADLLVLDDQSPMLAGHDRESILDALVFSGFTLPIDRVMVAGSWRVIDGEHIAAGWASGEYSKVVKGLVPDLVATL